MKKISVVVPMYYEEEIVDVCYKELLKNLKKIKNYDYEIIFVNDGSLDKTLDLLEKIGKKDKKVKIISFSRNFGHQAAVSAGLKFVSGDVALIIDADLQDPPELIHDMIKEWENGYEVVYGQRKSRDGESKFKLLTAKLFYRILNKFSSVNIPMDTGDFRLVDRKVVDVMNSLPEHNKFLRGLFSFTGFKQKAFLYERHERYAGKTKYTLKKMIKLASDGIVGFSYKPLNVILVLSIINIVIALCSFISLIWINNYLLMIMIGLVGFSTFAILFSIWLLSLYISRIYDEVRNRPSYIIDKVINVEV